MNSVDRAKWDRYQADLDRGLKKGMLTIRRGGVVMNTKTAPLAEEDKIQHKILGLKLKAQRQLSHLGARVYSLMAFKGRNPGLDASVKDITARLRRYETEIDAMEKQLRTMQKKLEKQT
jgi:peptidoglycan hydrolase CwlO-like protein